MSNFRSQAEYSSVDYNRFNVSSTGAIISDQRVVNVQATGRLPEFTWEVDRSMSMNVVTNNTKQQ